MGGDRIPPGLALNEPFPQAVEAASETMVRTLAEHEHGMGHFYNPQSGVPWINDVRVSGGRTSISPF